ncbi:hypothetical protein [Dyella sp. 20L07]|uniref:hypothetical protein n=1 Tax=Dyella sp. 20L07 TaxID=3384240 RepID=UPI003D27FDE6
MKSRKPFLAFITAGSMMLAGSLMAQDQSMTPPPPPPAPAAPMPPPPAPPMPSTTMGNAQASAQFNTPQGQVTINSTVPPVNAGPPPSFEQLSGGSRYITEDQASAYPLLANDFIYVDKGHTGRISKAQYEHWVNNNK